VITADEFLRDLLGVPADEARRLIREAGLVPLYMEQGEAVPGGHPGAVAYWAERGVVVRAALADRAAAARLNRPGDQTDPRG
jgi:hypothetical protein